MENHGEPFGTGETPVAPGGSPRSYIVRESGIRPVYDEERLRGARYSDLISTDPGKALMLRRRSLLSWGWLLVNAAALASIGWLLLRRR